MQVKSNRLLLIYSRLMGGDILSKRELAEQFQVTERSIQRDIDALRCFLMEQELRQELVYSKRAGGYYIRNRTDQTLSNSEILAVCKILLESRSMRKDEMFPILDKLIADCVPFHTRKAVKDLIANEKFHYIEPHHNTPILSGLWDLGQAIENHQLMDLEYERLKEPREVQRRVAPVGLMFSEFYFYLIAYTWDAERMAVLEREDSPTIYRVDRIHTFQVLEERFSVPYISRFEEGEFRKRVQFMYGGQMKVVRFHYSGPSLEAVLDRLPTARILNQDETGWTLEAEVFGQGAEMWLRSQGAWIQMLPSGKEEIAP